MTSIVEIFSRKLFLPLKIILLFAPLNSLCQVVHPVSFYLESASKNSPALKENINKQSAIAFQYKLITSQVKSPQVSVSSDYLFAPFFNSNNKTLDFTNNPSSKAIGYDVGITNGGLYSALLNISVPLLSAKAYRPLFNQNQILTNQLSNEQLAILHDLEKNVTDLYIAALQLQQQAQNNKELSELLEERINIVNHLVEKGLMSAADLLLLQIEKGNRLNDLLDLQIKYKTAIIQLNNICGISDTATVVLAAPAIEVSKRKTSFNYLEKYRIDSLIYVTDQQVFNVKYLPQISVFGNTGLNAVYAPNIPQNFGLSAGLHLAIPIYDGGQRRLNSSIAQVNQQILYDYKNNFTLQLTNNLDLIESQISQKQNLISLEQQQLKQYQTLLSIYTAQVVNGQLSAIDFVNSLSQYKIAQQTKIQSQTDLLFLISQYNYLNW